MSAVAKDTPVIQSQTVLEQMQALLAQLPQGNLESEDTPSIVPPAREGGTTRRRGRPPKTAQAVALNDTERNMVDTGLVPKVTPGQKTFTSPAEAHASKQTNKPTFEGILADVKELGERAGKGADVQIQYLLKMCEGAFLGVLDTESNKHGQDKDDATALAESYWKARQGAVIFDAKAANQRKTISTMRTMIKLGMFPKVTNPYAALNDLVALRQKLRKDPANAKKLDDAANTALRFARTQLKRDTLIDDEDELRSFCFKKEGEEETLSDVIEAIRKKAKKWGEQTIVVECNKRLTQIASGK